MAHPADPASRQPSRPRGSHLTEISARFAEELIRCLNEAAHHEVAAQVNSLVVPDQSLAGTADDFSFLVYPYPVLTKEQRGLLAFDERENLQPRVFDGLVEFDLDGFGFINWMYVKGLPDVWQAFLRFEGHFSAFTPRL